MRTAKRNVRPPELKIKRSIVDRSVGLVHFLEIGIGVRYTWGMMGAEGGDVRPPGRGMEDRFYCVSTAVSTSGSVQHHHMRRVGRIRLLRD